MVQILIRVCVGGVVVSLFAVLGDILKPKSFAGLFGAAPAIALATIALTIAKEGPHYVAIEARSMILGAIAFFLYACTVSRFLMKARWSALQITLSALSVWCVSALISWWLFLR